MQFMCFESTWFNGGTKCFNVSDYLHHYYFSGSKSWAVKGKETALIISYYSFGNKLQLEIQKGKIAECTV